MNVFLIVLFDIGFYCDIFTNIHAGIYCYSYILVILTVQSCGNSLFIVFLNGLKPGPGCLKAD